ncbi:hypothetical protein ACFWUW_30140 [Streptomyces sp. NPDC058655]|uniref:hypothetical protein n=1 Tax=Streptomyces sp. NPDC058655 TaxID=3346577 RepID=UPI00365716C7
MSLFTGTSSYYRQNRPGIPGDLAARLATYVPDRRPRRLLDVGTGTDLVAEALMPYFTDTLAQQGVFIGFGLPLVGTQMVTGVADSARRIVVKTRP